MVQLHYMYVEKRPVNVNIGPECSLCTEQRLCGHVKQCEHHDYCDECQHQRKHWLEARLAAAFLGLEWTSFTQRKL